MGVFTTYIITGLALLTPTLVSGGSGDKPVNPGTALQNCPSTGLRTVFENLEVADAPNIASFISPLKNSDFLPALTSAEKVFGENTFSGAERQHINELKTLLASLVSERKRVLSESAQKIQARNTEILPEKALKLARRELDKNPNFQSIDLQIQQTKTALAQIYDLKLKMFGVDLYASLDQLRAGLKQLDPFEVAGFTDRRFPYNRGEKLEITVSDAYLEPKFKSHQTEFDPALDSVEAYAAHVRQFAASTNPRIISFTGRDASGSKVHYKYDPVTNELLVVSADKKRVLTFFRPTRKSKANPRGYDLNKTPLQFVLRKYY